MAITLIYSIEGRVARSLELSEDGRDCPRLPTTGSIQHRLARYLSGMSQKALLIGQDKNLLVHTVTSAGNIPFSYLMNSSS